MTQTTHYPKGGRCAACKIPAELVPVVMGGVGQALRGERNYHLAVLQQQFKIEVTA